MLPIFAKKRARPYFERVAAAEHETHMVQRPCGLHYGEIWHVHVCAGDA